MQNELDETLFDHEHTIVNLSNAILAHYGVKPFHKPLDEALSLFEGHRKIAVFLFDALGEVTLNTYKKQSAEFLKNAKFTIYSTNPATTVASTTAFLTAKFPIETGYLGWSLYFDELGYPVEVFPNTNAITGEEVGEDNYMEKVCPTTKIDKLLTDNGVDARLFFPSPIDENGPKTLKGSFKAASSFFDNGGEFAYIYHPEPDHSLHKEGLGGRHPKKIIAKAAKYLKRFAKEHPDVLVISIADHGMANVIMRDISAFPILYSYISKPISIEGRTTSISIKEGKEKEFEEEFNKRFPNILLLKRESVLEKGYFGEGEINPKCLEFIGDYVALSNGPDLLVDSKTTYSMKVHKGHHAGILPSERRIVVASWNE